MQVSEPLPSGAVRFTEEYLKSDPVTEEEYQQAVQAIEEALDGLIFEEKVNKLLVVGGAMTNLSAIKHKLPVYDSDIIQGSQLRLSDLKKQIELFKSKTIAERKRIIGLRPERAVAHGDAAGDRAYCRPAQLCSLLTPC